MEMRNTDTKSRFQLGHSSKSRIFSYFEVLNKIFNLYWTINIGVEQK